jgi:hypothetical protein
MKQFIDKILFGVRMLLGFNLISLKHIINMAPRRFLYACADAFSAARSSMSYELDQIPGISLDAILGERQPSISMRVVKYEDGMLPNNELMVLLSILVADSPEEVLEIGTYMGHTTRQMAENLRTATIHTVDLPEHFSVKDSIEQQLPMDDFHIIKRRIVGREFKGQACESRIKQHFVDTASWDFNSAGHPTFFFIDGSHTYEYCMNDSEKCLDLCKGHGVFLWHDCDDRHPGVVRLVLEWRRQGRDIRRIFGTSMAYWKSI